MNKKHHLADVIRDTAKQIREVHRKVYGPDFIPQYAALVDLLFPGGYDAGLRGIQAGDAAAIEAALTFLEVRPYFFRSQYIRTHLIRLLKHAVLSPDQAERFEPIKALEHRKKMESKKHS